MNEIMFNLHTQIAEKWIHNLFP